jgi:hypothetical protein
VESLELAGGRPLRQPAIFGMGRYLELEAACDRATGRCLRVASLRVSVLHALAHAARSQQAGLLACVCLSRPGWLNLLYARQQAGVCCMLLCGLGALDEFT